MSLIAGAPKPSAWQHRVNGGADKIHGYDDGEAEIEYRSTPGASCATVDEVETLIQIERLTKINNN